MSNDPDDEVSVVPLLMQNKPPIGDDSADDKMADLELRPEEVSQRERAAHHVLGNIVLYRDL